MSQKKDSSFGSQMRLDQHAVEGIISKIISEIQKKKL